ncbi:MAG TPA: ornithine cyclodeaminase [Alphaproteobacteria bacterium]|nr:ornithine cyclodeaminase [Alphaproteobacteria bacterium]
MRFPTSPVVLDQDQLWRAGLDRDYQGMIRAARQALLDLEAGLAAGAKATVAPRDGEIRDFVDPERGGFDFASEDLDWKLSALVSVNRRHGAVKIVGANAYNRCLGLPRSRSTILLFDKLTMLPLAMLDGTDISAVRTGAYASMAADLFYAPRRAGSVVMFGAGRIAEAVIRCLDASHAGRIGRITLMARDASRAEAFAGRLQGAVSIELAVARDRSPLADADLLITATTARGPVVAAEEIPPRITTLLLGGDELPEPYIEATLADGLVYCDNAAAVAHRNVQSLALHCSRRGGCLTQAPVRSLAQEMLHPVWEAGRAVHVSCIGLPVLDLYVTEYLYDRLEAVERLAVPELRRAG